MAYPPIELQLMYVVDGILTPLSPSTATIQGKFTNVELSSDMIDMFYLTGNIISASSNDGTVMNENYQAPVVGEKKSKRGRKKKEKPKTKRCKNGKFGSMIQFEIKSIYKRDKVYKIKAFNKETFQVPGVLDPKFRDVIPALTELARFLENGLGCDKVEVVCIKPLMRNYICRINNPIYRINLAAFARFISTYQNSETSRNELINRLRQRSSFRHNNTIKEIEKLIPINHMGIVSIQFDLEKYAGIKIKFKRPMHNIIKQNDAIKYITIKIYQSGKINIDGGKEVAEIEELYMWLNSILMKNEEELIIDINQIMQHNLHNDEFDEAPIDNYEAENANIVRISTTNNYSHASDYQFDSIETASGDDEDDYENKDE